MKKIKLSTLGFCAMAMLSLFFTGCTNSNDATGTSGVSVRLADAPGDYKEVNIDVRDIMIKNNSNSDDQGWVSIGNIPAGGKIYNLLELTGGVNALLANKVVPSGYLGQVRLVLGDGNTVKLNDGTIKTLNTPSAQQSGLKIQVNQTLLSGATYDFLLDLDVEHSVVVQAGASGIYNLHPVIRVSTTATSGVIKGSVTPTGIAVSASVVVAGVPVSTPVNATTGVFQLNGIPAGTYTVTLTPDPTSLYAEKTIANVVVTNGLVVDMGSQVLVLKP